MRWRSMAEEPRPRTRVLLLNGNLRTVSLGTWERTSFAPHRYAYACECGWFPPAVFAAWMPTSELIDAYGEGM